MRWRRRLSGKPDGRFAPGPVIEEYIRIVKDKSLLRAILAHFQTEDGHRRCADRRFCAMLIAEGLAIEGARNDNQLAFCIRWSCGRTP